MCGVEFDAVISGFARTTNRFAVHLDDRLDLFNRDLTTDLLRRFRANDRGAHRLDLLEERRQ